MVICVCCSQQKKLAFISFMDKAVCLDCLGQLSIIATKLGIAGFYENIRKYQKVTIEEPGE